MPKFGKLSAELNFEVCNESLKNVQLENAPLFLERVTHIILYLGFLLIGSIMMTESETSPYFSK